MYARKMPRELIFETRALPSSGQRLNTVNAPNPVTRSSLLNNHLQTCSLGSDVL